MGKQLGGMAGYTATLSFRRSKERSREQIDRATSLQLLATDSKLISILIQFLLPKEVTLKSFSSLKLVLNKYR